MDDDRQLEMKDNGEWQNGEYHIIDDDRQWIMTDNWWWHNWWWQTMETL